MMTKLAAPTCPFCRRAGLKLTYERQYHKVARDFGPFDIAICEGCGSLATLNPPSRSQLAAFYAAYESNRPDWYLAAKDSRQLEDQYAFYCDHILAMSGDQRKRKWCDIGAGHGEVASLLAQRAPNSEGLAIDIPERPENLPPSVSYTSIDLNLGEWRAQLGDTFDTVYSIAVWEHVRDPFAFAAEAISLVAPGGELILVCPAYDSWARRLMRRNWPYFQPGEHLFVPTTAGAKSCLEQIIRDRQLDADINVRRISVGYNIRYVARVIGLGRLSHLLPNISAPAPTGILSARVRLRSNSNHGDAAQDEKASQCKAP